MNPVILRFIHPRGHVDQPLVYGPLPAIGALVEPVNGLFLEVKRRAWVQHYSLAEPCCCAVFCEPITTPDDGL